MRLRTKLIPFIISAGLCFSLVADAKTVKIPKWIFGFTFGASVAVHRAQCKALKGTWNYKFDLCEDPRLVGFPECNTPESFHILANGRNNEYEDGTTSSSFSFAVPSSVACSNKWLEWAHYSFGEPSCKNDTGFWWEHKNNYYIEYIQINPRLMFTFIWFHKTTSTAGWPVCDD